MGAKRNSNFELLRMIAMMMIVVGHVVSPTIQTGSGFVDCFMGSGLRVAVNVFVILGAWFGVDSEFRADRFLRLYLKTWFFSVFGVIVLFVLNGTVGVGDIARGILPYFGVSYWYVTVYLTLLLLAPLLNGFFRLSIRRQTCILLPIGVYCCLFASYPHTQLGTMEKFLGWFVYVYLLTGLAKRSGFCERKAIRICLPILGFGAYTSIAAIRYLGCVLHSDFLSELANLYVHDLVTLPNILSAAGLFVFFLNIKPRSDGIVNFLARHTFGVYLAHFIALNVIRHEPYGILAKNDRSVLIALTVSMVAYMAGWLASFVHARLIEPLYTRLGFNRLCRALDEGYNRVIKNQ